MRRVFLLSLLLVALSLLIPWLAVTLTPAGEPANKKSSPKQDLSEEKFTGSR